MRIVAKRRLSWLLLICCGGVILLGTLIPRKRLSQTGDGLTLSNRTDQSYHSASPALASKPKPERSAEAIVAARVEQFAHDRLRIARAMAKRIGVELPDETALFFKAVAAGQWDELNEHYRKLESIRDNDGSGNLRKVWGPILETLLIAECAHDWPAQKLLDYGKATIGSLPSDMVYMGGTDPGRGIPTLLNETSGGDRHIIITQNGLADSTYLDYVRFLYGDKISLPTPDETATAFNEYVADAQKRLEHDRQFPDEPKQIRPGEDIRWAAESDAEGVSATNRTIQVSGNLAVMAVNERIFQAIMDKNPGLSFALEESFPLRSTYSAAVPLGPIMELRATDPENTYNAKTAGDTLEYWRNTAQQLISDVEAPEGSAVRKTYSKMASAQANLLAEHNFSEAAEQTYRLAMQMEPSSPEAVYSLADLLAKNNRSDEAQQLISTFQQSYPSQPPLAVPSLTRH